MFQQSVDISRSRYLLTTADSYETGRAGIPSNWDHQECLLASKQTNGQESAILEILDKGERFDSFRLVFSLRFRQIWKI